MSAKATIIGRLASQPTYVLVNTQYGDMHVLKCQVISNESYQDQNGQWQNSSSSFFVQFKGPLALKLAQNGTLQKGYLVHFECKLKSRSYEKNGTTSYTTDFNVENFNLLSKPQSVANHNQGIPATVHAPQQAFQNNQVQQSIQNHQGYGVSTPIVSNPQTNSYIQQPVQALQNPQQVVEYETEF